MFLWTIVTLATNKNSLRKETGSRHFDFFFGFYFFSENGKNTNFKIFSVIFLPFFKIK
jgi:hypothetical protein